MLTAGENFLHYDIISAIGEGGMGEVYLAKDRHLERKVAIKLLRKKFINNEAGLRRFVLEAKAASALNHPNIITIYEIGRSDDSQYIATEYIEGHTLHKLLATDSLDLEEILNITVQVAEALNAAHNAGIVHRDIKPENIMVRKDGYVKVLDFGLAKLLDQEDLPIDVTAKTQKMFETNPGVIMGTVSYMSPEQARGTAVDTRSDIWSLGVVLFQMLTGKLPFTGETTSDVIAALLKAPIPKLGDFAPDSPKELEHVIDKALRRNREDRYQNIKDFLIDLKDLKQELNLSGSNGHRTERRTDFFERPATTGNGHVEISTLEPGHRRTHSLSGVFLSQFKLHPVMMAVALLVLTPLIVAGVIYGLKRLSDTPTNRESFEKMRLSKLTNIARADGGQIAISPDGKYIAYVVQADAMRSLWMRQVSASGGAQITAPANANFKGLTFSKDGNYIYYSVSQGAGPYEIFKISALGGDMRKITEGEGPIYFSPDGKWFSFIREKTLMIADTDGNSVRTLAQVNDGSVWWMPAWSPDGKNIICSVFSSSDTMVHFVDVSVDDGSQTEFSQTRWLRINGISWMPDGKSLTFIGRDPETQLSQLWQITYPEGNVSRITNDLSSYQGLSLTSDGSAAVTIQENRLSNIWVASEANPDSPQKITSETGRDDGLSGVAWAPDGRIVYTTRLTGSPDLWMVNRDGTNNRQLTFNAKANFSPVVTPDGRFIIFVSTRTGQFDLWRINVDGSNPTQLTNDAPIEAFPDVTPDGKWILYQLEDIEGRSTIWKMPVEGGNAVQLTKIDSGRPLVSPDGKSIACAYGRSGEPTKAVHAAIIRMDNGQPIKQFDIPSANFRWATDGKSLIYIYSDGQTFGLHSVPVNGSSQDKKILRSDRVFRFDLSRYGSGFALAIGRENSDVVMIRDFK